uniref:Xylanolytic transcriptional activator regulatory domain-containing protein n=1 Tax=Ganoderma boninense TaxID=34458 RepID=A0A5K1JZY9_9APHY|nr:Eukaryotic translation initiation factor 3 subunit G (eIF3g) (Eukaryotic translation initiation factor 3 RNA-binding subunit) (eIF-3 RNA-binding subunit) (Translation initiation factor eIF3 p33 subunit homolog) (eIF3 p33 homolog) [Ganoderma boninense]
MEGTPGLDLDSPHTPAGAMHFPSPTAPSSSTIHPSNAHVTEQANGGAGSSQAPSGPKFSNGPDVQTLHNRMIEIERVLAQLQATAPSASVSTALSTFKQPTPVITGPSRVPVSSAPSSGLLAGFPCSDRALLAQGASGSSVVINLEDVVSLWLSELEDFGSDSKARTSGQDASAPTRPSSSTATVKLEPAPVSIPPAQSASFSPGNGSHIPIGGFSTLHPPALYESFLPPASAGPSALPQVTAALISYLPSEPARSHYLRAFRETMLLHPSFNVPHFEQRIAAVFSWAETGESAPTAVPAYGKPPMSKQDLARDIFFSSSKPGSALSRAATGPGGPPGGSGPSSNTPKPTLSFFSAACSAFALGSLVSRDEGHRADEASPSGSSAGAVGETSGTSAMLFALSEQALQLFEKTAAYDLDSVIAMILQVLYMLHEGGMSVAQSVFPLVGKMVNVARMMGLAMDPDEFPGTYNLFEAETRRRVWWEVYYYDLFVADAMGHPPLIADNTHTTRLPADVEEGQFTPSCTSLPVPEDIQGDSSSIYFGLKCRLAQLVKNVKKQTFRDPLGGSDEASTELSIDYAGTFEAEVTAFLQELPAGFRLEMAQDLSKPVPPLPAPGSGSPSAIRVAQKCELAILANRLVVKLYLPFLKEAAAAGRPSHQAVFGTINAAHNIICASRTLHGVWGQTRPAVFDFYDFGRTLFDAAVVCAHAVVQEPGSIIAPEGMKSVACALDILKELGSSRVGVEGARGDAGASSRSEAVKIVEMMKRKAEAARSGGGVAAGTKRKHAEVEGETLAPSSSASFQLPFVGAAVSSSKAERPRSNRAGGTTAAHGKDAEKAKSDAKKHGKEKEKKDDKDKDKDKASKYPNGPLRMRPMTGQPSSSRRQRTASVSAAPTSAAPTPTATAAAPPPPPPAPAPVPRVAPAAPTPSPPNASMSVTLSPPSSSSSQVQASSSRASVSVPGPSPVTASAPYDAYPPAPPVQHEPQPQDDYAMQYSSPDSVTDDRRYSAAQSSYDSPQSTGTIYDPQPQPQPQYAPSPVTAYPPPQSQPQGGYYLSYPPQPGTPGGYEGHAAMMAMMAPPPPPPPHLRRTRRRRRAASCRR